MSDLFDLDAERAVLGGMLVDPEAAKTAVKALRASDFGMPSHRAVFDIAAEHHARGEEVDARTLAALLDKQGHLESVGGAAGIVSLWAGGAMRSKIRQEARTVVGMAVRRRLAGVAEELNRLATDFTVDAPAAVQAARSEVAGIELPVAGSPADLWDLDEFLDRPLEARPEWVAPGLLRQGWRTLVVAPEGAGKSMLFRQFAICVAQGLHPFTLEPARKVRTLMVDLENPEDILRDKATPIRDQARRQARPYVEGQAWLWHRPGGIDLRSRADAGELEACVREVRPELVCLGPLYKAYRVGSRENDELATGEVQHLLDDLRTRYSFALLLEHHAPKKQQGHRELVPYGSSLWLRWPEMGLKLVPVERPAGSLSVERWRGDRAEAAWPARLDRSRPWPWSGHYPEGFRHG